MALSVHMQQFGHFVFIVSFLNLTYFFGINYFIKSDRKGIRVRLLPKLLHYQSAIASYYCYVPFCLHLFYPIEINSSISHTNLLHDKKSYDYNPRQTQIYYMQLHFKS